MEIIAYNFNTTFIVFPLYRRHVMKGDLIGIFLQTRPQKRSYRVAICVAQKLRGIKNKRPMGLVPECKQHCHKIEVK